MDKTIYSGKYAAFLRLLREARQNANVSQVTLAERMKVTQTFISKCERGERRLDIVELWEWCRALGLNLADFAEEVSDVFLRPH